MHSINIFNRTIHTNGKINFQAIYLRFFLNYINYSVYLIYIRLNILFFFLEIFIDIYSALLIDSNLHSKFRKSEILCMI